MTSLRESYLAGYGFDITTPGMKTDYRSTALPTVLPGSMNMRTCMHMCVRAQMCACLNVRVFMRATEGRTDGQRMVRWVDLNGCACVCGWTDRWIAKWMHGWTHISAYMGTCQSS